MLALRRSRDPHRSAWCSGQGTGVPGQRQVALNPWGPTPRSAFVPSTPRDGGSHRQSLRAMLVDCRHIEWETVSRDRPARGYDDGKQRAPDGLTVSSLRNWTSSLARTFTSRRAGVTPWRPTAISRPVARGAPGQNEDPALANPCMTTTVESSKRSLGPVYHPGSNGRPPGRFPNLLLTQGVP